jgi:DNA-binding transcriptional MerR regulator
MEGMMMGMLSVAEVSVQVGVTVTRIEYAETKKRLPEPKRWRNHKVYTEDDVEVIRNYFKGRKPWTKEVSN